MDEKKRARPRSTEDDDILIESLKIRVTPKLRHQIEAAAASEHRSVSNWAREALRCHLPSGNHTAPSVTWTEGTFNDG